MPTVRELLTTWGFNVDFKTLERMDTKVGQLKNEIGSVGQHIETFGKKLASTGLRLSAFVTVPIAGMLTSFTAAAANAEETEAKFSEVFISVERKAQNVAKELAKSYGLGKIESKSLLAATGDLLTGFKFSEDTALDLSIRVQQLAADLESFQNFQGGVEGASLALTKALLGERESVKALGISILEEDVKRQVALNTSKGITFESERQAKAFATLQLAEEQSTKALGDKQRTMRSTTNQFRLMISESKDLAIELGKFLIPTARDLISVFRSTINWFTNLESETQKNILKFLIFVATIGPAIFLLGVFITTIIKLTRALKFLSIAIGAVQLSALTLPILIGLGIALIVGLFDEITKFFDGQKTLLGEFIGSWENVKKKIFDIWDSLSERSKLIAKTIWDSFIAPFKLIGNIIDYGKNALNSIFIENPELVNAGSGAISGYIQPELVNAGSGVIRRSNNSVNVNATVNMQVPDGTPESQIKLIKEEGAKVVRQEFETIIRQTQNDFVESE